MAVIVSVLAFLMTLAGGLTAMRVRDHRHLVLGIAGGLMLGVVAFDLIPESLELTRHRPFGVPAPMLGFAAGFVLLHVVEQAVAVHRAHEEDYAPHAHARGSGAGGLLAALALILHSLVDGLSIGFGFQSGTETGAFVALAVVTHDFADGFNTFTAASLHRADRRPAVLLLLADAAAPVAGAAIGMTATVPDAVLGPYLGVFAGVLLYLAAAEILPEAHSVHPRVMTLAATGLGILAVLLGVGLAS
ncbi:ZIP family metal transporter [Actinomadura sp. DSM 109109]|nr:ZIP family metal transporter [Actinomadura lepetitiana]